MYLNHICITLKIKFMKINNYVLALSVAINVMFIFSQCGSPEPSNEMAKMEKDTSVITSDCNDDSRYSAEEQPGGGECISSDKAKENIKSFHEEFKIPIKGAFFSKRAIDAIFCSNLDLNGIVCYMAKTESDSNSVTIIIEGARSDSTSIKECDEGNPAIFRATAKCPNLCTEIADF